MKHDGEGFCQGHFYILLFLALTLAPFMLKIEASVWRESVRAEEKALKSSLRDELRGFSFAFLFSRICLACQDDYR